MKPFKFLLPFLFIAAPLLPQDSNYYGGLRFDGIGKLMADLGMTPLHQTVAADPNYPSKCTYEVWPLNRVIHIKGTFTIKEEFNEHKSDLPGSDRPHPEVDTIDIRYVTFSVTDDKKGLGDQISKLLKSKICLLTFVSTKNSELDNGLVHFIGLQARHPEAVTFVCKGSSKSPEMELLLFRLGLYQTWAKNSK